MTSLKLSFDSADTSGRGSVFVFRDPKAKKTEVYLRAKVANPGNINAGLARLFLTRMERVDPKGKKSLITDDTLPFNWANSAGADREFYPGFEHYADLVTFTEGAKAFKPMTLRTPAYWEWELGVAGVYHLHLLLAGATIQPRQAVFQLKWPLKNLSLANFLFDLKR